MSRSVEITIPDMPPKVLRKNGRPANRDHQRRVTAEQRARAGEYVMEAISGKDHADYKFSSAKACTPAGEDLVGGAAGQQVSQPALFQTSGRH